MPKRHASKTLTCDYFFLLSLILIKNAKGPIIGISTSDLDASLNLPCNKIISFLVPDYIQQVYSHAPEQGRVKEKNWGPGGQRSQSHQDPKIRFFNTAGGKTCLMNQFPCWMSFWAREIKSASAMAPGLSPLRRRKATCPASASWSPITSM